MWLDEGGADGGNNSFCGPLGANVWADRINLDFTPCFEDSMMMVPKVGLLIASVFDLYYKCKKSPLELPRHGKILLYAKLITVGLLVVIGLVNTGLVFSTGAVGTSIVSNVTTFLAMSYALFLHYYLHARSRRSSSVLLLFWMFFFFASMMKLRGETTISRDMQQIYYSSSEAYYLSFFTLPLIALVFSLENFTKTFVHRERLLSSDEEADTTTHAKPCPEQEAGIFSRLSFWWMNPLMVLGYSKPLNEDDLWDLNNKDKAQVISDRFQSIWQQELPKRKPSLLMAFVKTFGFTFATAGILKFIQDSLAFVQPQLLKALINFVHSFHDGQSDEPLRNGFVISGLMFLVAVTQSAALHQYFHICFNTGMRLRAAVVTAIYQKSLRLSSSARQQFTIGETVNLMSVDAQRLMDLCTYLHILWSGPYQITMALYFLYQNLGWSIFAGVAVMVLTIPLNTFLASKSKGFQKTQMTNKDNRIKTMDEMLSGMKVIKLYAWEDSFLAKILDIRSKEMLTLKKIAFFNAFTGFFWTCNPLFIALATFGVYTMIAGGTLTSDKTFVSLALFNLLQFPMTMFPSVITSSVEASVALGRILKFLVSEELKSDNVNRSGSSSEHAVEVTHGNFLWGNDTSQPPILSDITFKCKPGEVVAVVGKVGSGKSSLLSALLGEMTKASGKIQMRGRVAYIPQQAWIMNATVRDNVTFSKPYEDSFYNSVIDNCALRPDLDMLPAGDATEIGEKGINLSGGQKQRISIARAVYNDADVYLFDDPLSAVDAHVGKHIFNKVIGNEGVLKNKARIFVTNAVQYLPRVDLIIMLENGRISEIGTYQELLQARSNFYNLVSEYGSKVSQEKEEEADGEDGAGVADSSSSSSSSTTPSEGEKQKSETPKKQEDKLIIKEEQVQGSVSFDVYKEYARSISFGSVVFVILLFICSQTVSVGTNLWLSHWSNVSASGQDDRIGFYLGIYGMFGVLQSLFTLVTLGTFALFGIKAASYLHEELLKSVLKAPMAFFDTTPLGRILNRFSKDQYTVDETLPSSFQSYFRTLFNVISIFFVIVYSTPLFVVGAIPLGIVYFFIQRYYIASSRELKRLDSIKRSPIYAHFSETLSGVSTIRAYDLTERFVAENEKRLNESQKAYYPSIASNRWLATRLEFIGNTVVLMAGVFAVMEHDNVNAGQVGLSITYALSITQTLNWMVRQSSEIETNIVSVERIKEYIDIKHEAQGGVATPPTWPELGSIRFHDYSTTYREGLPLVLQNISCSINSQEKIGIVGRTGAGKSSITLSLFRIIEALSGKIEIDGREIASLKLKDLRSKITIIPQDPVLFAGTIRSNLDPFNKYTDKEIMSALASCHLKNQVESLELGLDSPVTQNGENFSVGQRQLMCLGRALLRKTKILVLDEATAAIDVETDDFIQKTIRREFADCTIITIAHRINTIIDCDRILVLDRGRIQEFDTPQKLLGNQTSLFYSLAHEAGLI